MEQQAKRRYEAPAVGTRYGKLTVTEDNDVYRQIGVSKYTKRCAVLSCDCGGEITVSHSNLRWATYRSCTKCPYQCLYCGNEDISLKRTDTISNCQRCNAAFRHKVPWTTYERWLKDGCRICGSHAKMHIDHDHKCCSIKSTTTCGQCTRGLLCSTHNQAVGFYERGLFNGVEDYLNDKTPYLER
jgi:hypothetical protein